LEGPTADSEKNCGAATREPAVRRPSDTTHADGLYAHWNLRVSSTVAKQSVSTYIEVAGSDVAAAVAAYAAVMTNDM
jgi:hypothetical protein